jgi:SAM-dependent methyltransferase
MARVPSGHGSEELARAESFVDSLLPRHSVLKVFAAEAGAQFTVRSPAYVVGVHVLQAERTTRRDADEYRAADLERVELEVEEYDVVVCCNVLEHVRKPLAVLPLVWDALKAGGLLVIMVPNVVSLKGLLTRLTPLALHRWYYSRIVGRPYSSQHAPAVHSLSLRPRSLLKHARSGGWAVEYLRVYEGGVQWAFRQRFGLVGRRWTAVVWLTRVLSLGLLTAEGTGVIAVLQKPALAEVVAHEHRADRGSTSPEPR